MLVCRDICLGDLDPTLILVGEDFYIDIYKHPSMAHTWRFNEGHKKQLTNLNTKIVQEPTLMDIHKIDSD